MRLPKAVEIALRKIMKANGQAYLIGGALRDWMLNKSVTDYDIASSLLPDQIEEVFSTESVRFGGKRFGTVTVNIDNVLIEITTFRKESDYSDSRHPDQVAFVSDIHKDLARRDFTINAMAYNPYESSGLIDPFMGREDLQNRLIRAVGNPVERFTEDPLRIMRGIRFSAELNFEIHNETRKAMKACCPLLQKVSAERLRSEWDSLLLAPHPDKGLLLLQETGALTFLLYVRKRMTKDGLKPHLILNKQSAQMIKRITPNLVYRLSTLFSMLYPEDFADAGRLDGIRNIMIQLRYDRKTINHIPKMLQAYFAISHMDITSFSIRKLIGGMGMQDFDHCLSWYREISKIKQDLTGNRRAEKALELFRDIVRQKDPVFFYQLSINGKDVLNAGLGQQDPKIVGEALNLAYEWVLEHPSRNQPDCLIPMLKKHYSSLIQSTLVREEK